MLSLRDAMSDIADKYRDAGNCCGAGTPAAGWRGRAAIALGYEGAVLPVADVLADQAMAISDRPSLGLLNAVFGKAHTAALRGDHTTARRLLAQGRRVFDRAGSHEQISDYAVPHWRLSVFTSLLAARLGDETTAVAAQNAATADLPATLPRFATHLEMHRCLMLARSGTRRTGRTPRPDARRWLTSTASRGSWSFPRPA